MGISRRSSNPTGVTNASGEPEIVLELDGLTLSLAPPARPAPTPQRSVQDDDTDPADR